MVNQDFNIGELIPEISPNVEDKLIICLAKEVQLYTKSMKGTKCLLCPFRVLSRFSYLRRHLQYHCRENIAFILENIPFFYAFSIWERFF